MKFPEKYRAENPFDLNTILNFFLVPFRGRKLKVIASSDNEWGHVSVSLENRCPNWEEMCYIKDLFWDEEEVCIQFHPKKSEYVNAMPHCLHIWKPPHEISEMLHDSLHEKEK